MEALILDLDLRPHPEGGFYRETYRSEGIIAAEALGNRFPGPRNFATAIYFLLGGGHFSAFHRIRQDEIWHFYLGSALHLVAIDLEGNLTEHLLGNNLAAGERPQLVVPAGNWFAASVPQTGGYALAGCTVAPGFHFDDFEMAGRDELIHRYPRHAAVIRRFTR